MAYFTRGRPAQEKEAQHRQLLLLALVCVATGLFCIMLTQTPGTRRDSAITARVAAQIRMHLAETQVPDRASIIASFEELASLPIRVDVVDLDAESITAPIERKEMVRIWLREDEGELVVCVWGTPYTRMQEFRKEGTGADSMVDPKSPDFGENQGDVDYFLRVYKTKRSDP
jgi:hypothetical protein